MVNFKKTVLVTAFSLVLGSAYADDLNIQSYAAQQSEQLPELHEYDGFIVYLRDDVANRSGDSDVLETLSESLKNSGAKVVNRLSSGGVLVRSKTDLGTFRSSRSAVQYLEEENKTIYDKLKANPEVELVEPNLIMKPTMRPNDPDYSRLWGLQNTYGIRVESVWDRYQGEGVTVAVIDSGIVPHSDLNANVVRGYDFISDAGRARDNNGRDNDPTDEGDWRYLNECNPNLPSRFISSSWHGSHVAGTIAMTGNNYRGAIGVAPKAKILPARALGKCGGTLADIADAIVWSAGGYVPGVPSNNNRAQVINMSLGGGGRCSYTYQRAINEAVRRGTTVVVAAGNENQDASRVAPANCDNVVVVAALGSTGNRASYSNYGSVIDVAAPGGDQRSAGSRSAGIFSTVDRGQRRRAGESYGYKDGTSMATPHVAGLAALLLQKSPNLTPAQVEQRLKAGTRPLPGRCPRGCGRGLIDAPRTLSVNGGGDGGDGGNTGGKEYTANATVQSGQTVATRGFQANAGTHKGNLTVNNSYADMELSLEKQSSWGDWTQVATDNATGSVTYRGSAGTYRWKIQSYYGGSQVTLKFVKP